MTRAIGIVFLVGASLGVASPPDASAVRTGWFGDENCTKPHATRGPLGPPGRDCTRECIRKGVPVVFLDEGSKSVYRVDNPEITRDQESHHVEIVGTIDEDKRTIHVTSVKVLEKYVAKCAAH